jgi:hypothetical protein
MKTWFALTSYWRATFDTEAPGTRVAATISRFTASGQRLFRRHLCPLALSWAHPRLTNTSNTDARIGHSLQTGQAVLTG